MEIQGSSRPLTGNLELHLAPQAAALVNFIIAHRPVLIVVTGYPGFHGRTVPKLQAQ